MPCAAVTAGKTARGVVFQKLFSGNCFLRRSFAFRFRGCMFRLQCQQSAFQGKSSGITDKPAVGSDDPVAWNDDGNGIPMTGQSDGAHSDGNCDFPVGGGLSVWNFQEALPDPFHEWRSLRIKRQVEVFSFSSEIFFQLAEGFLQKRRLRFRGWGFPAGRGIRKGNGGNRIVPFRDREKAERCFPA